MKGFCNLIQIVYAQTGRWLGYFLGGCDGLLNALIVFAAIDYITIVMCAVSDQKRSGEAGLKGICCKVLIFLLVGIGNIVDAQIIGTGSSLRSVVILFYLSIEGISILENAANLGLPIPDKLKIVLEQLREREK